MCKKTCLIAHKFVNRHGLSASLHRFIPQEIKFVMTFTHRTVKFIVDQDFTVIGIVEQIKNIIRFFFNVIHMPGDYIKFMGNNQILIIQFVNISFRIVQKFNGKAQSLFDVGKLNTFKTSVI